MERTAIQLFLGVFEDPEEWAIDMNTGAWPMVMAKMRGEEKIKWGKVSNPRTLRKLIDMGGDSDPQEFREKYDFWRDAPPWRFPQEEE